MALISCPECEKKISDKALSCPHCGYPINQTTTNSKNNTNNNLQSGNNYGLKCPACSSTNIIVGQKGFSGKKALAGAIAIGGIGLLAGNHGKNELICTCINCGHKFEPQKGITCNASDLWREIDAMLMNRDIDGAAQLLSNVENLGIATADSMVKERLLKIDPEYGRKIKRNDNIALIVGCILIIAVFVFIAFLTSS